MDVTNPDTVRDELRALHDTNGLRWRAIAQLEQYTPIPFGTLSAIYNGYPIPKKWHRRLGIPEPVFVPACPIPGCQEEYRHLHGLETFDPTIQKVYTPAVEHPTRNRPPRQYRDLFDTPTKVLRWQLEHRR